MTIRPSGNPDGPAIGKLYKDSELPDYGVDWESAKVGGWWLVAEEGDKIVGAVQLLAGQPYGYIGEIIVHPDHRAKGQNGAGGLTGRLGSVALDLLVTAFVALRAAGSQMVLGAVGKDIDALRKVYERHGALNLGEFTLMGRRLG